MPGIKPGAGRKSSRWKGSFYAFEKARPAEFALVAGKVASQGYEA
jgi:hypothetical protein